MKYSLKMGVSGEKNQTHYLQFLLFPWIFQQIFFALLGSIVKLKSFALQIINVSPPNTVLTVISQNVVI